jgi:hypothetical protein
MGWTNPALIDEEGNLHAGHGASRCSSKSGGIRGRIDESLTFEAKHSMVLYILTVSAMESKTGPFTFAELQTVTSLGRGEIRECINRGIISAPAGVGQGNHRSYNKWNLVEGVIAAALLRQVRAGAVEQIMKNLRSMLDYRQIDLDSYCETPSTFVYESIFPSRKEPDEKAGLPSGEEMGEGAYLLGAATHVPHHGPPLTRGTPFAAFCTLSIDLEQAVWFVSHMIESRF